MPLSRRHGAAPRSGMAGTRSVSQSPTPGPALSRTFERIDGSIARYLSLETADRHGDAVPEPNVERLKGKIEKLKRWGNRPAQLVDS